ncbi:hypothetical protein EVAR_78705_1 [Eumeta japonica]|uniref:Uncharacterized protein n=1 Tax=Eumeta variegata TaxID=151549 RepID=A0A4C1T166_EUMVA|nr:hypothetical protein EVAR_78705_1 [Eumeta japonica]
MLEVLEVGQSCEKNEDAAEQFDQEYVKNEGRCKDLDAGMRTLMSNKEVIHIKKKNTSPVPSRYSVPAQTALCKHKVSLSRNAPAQISMAWCGRMRISVLAYRTAAASAAAVSLVRRAAVRWRYKLSDVTARGRDSAARGHVGRRAKTRLDSKLYRDCARVRDRTRLLNHSNLSSVAYSIRHVTSDPSVFIIDTARRDAGRGAGAGVRGRSRRGVRCAYWNVDGRPLPAGARAGSRGPLHSPPRPRRRARHHTSRVKHKVQFRSAR